MPSCLALTLTLTLALSAASAASAEAPPRVVATIGTYTLTEMGQFLRPGELAELAMFVGSPFSWDPWSGLADSVRTGESAFTKHFGLPLFEYLDHHADQAQLYHAAIDAFSRREARALAEAIDFSEVRRVADVGRGHGTLLVEVLSKWEHLTGVLLERPAAAEQARLAFALAGIEDRCEARVGDFFTEVPQSVDVCVLMHIIHVQAEICRSRITDDFVPVFNAFFKS